MRANLVVFVVSLFVAASVFAAGKAEVVTAGPPALSASMTLVSNEGGCFTWVVTGKVRPEFRGFGARVNLVCTKYDSLSNGINLVFGASPFAPPCTGDACTPGYVDACGNFAFNATSCGTSPQLDRSYVCYFVVHVDGPPLSQSCSDAQANSAPAFTANNGTAPCAGGICPGGH